MSVGMMTGSWTASRGGSAGTVTCRFAVTITVVTAVVTLGSSPAIATAAVAANNMPAVKIRSVFIAAPLFVSMEHKVVLTRL